MWQVFGEFAPPGWQERRSTIQVVEDTPSEAESVKFVLRYPLVAGTLVALLAVAATLAVGQPGIAQVAASAYALTVAVYLAFGMARRVAAGQ